jgi:cytochrome c-type biogenesis protein CcmH
MLETIDIWQKLIAVLPQGSPQAEMIRDGLSRAMQTAKEQGLYQEEATSDVVDINVPVTVEISADLGEIPEGRLFVFALGDDGMPMPLAVKSLASNSLPVTVSLADADAMIPSRKISAFKTITVVARITKNGSVRAESGDVEGRTAPIALAEAQAGVTLQIDSRIP